MQLKNNCNLQFTSNHNHYCLRICVIVTGSNWVLGLIVIENVISQINYYNTASESMNEKSMQQTEVYKRSSERHTKTLKLLGKFCVESEMNCSLSLCGHCRLSHDLLGTPPKTMGGARKWKQHSGIKICKLACIEGRHTRGRGSQLLSVSKTHRKRNEA